MASIVEERVKAKYEEQLKQMYAQIGMTYYEDMKDKEVDASYIELFASIKKTKAIYDEEVLLPQGKRRCTNCQSVVALESKFCNMCGERLPEVVPVIKPEVIPNPNKCINCGTILEKDAMFCPNCGKKR